MQQQQLPIQQDTDMHCILGYKDTIAIKLSCLCSVPTISDYHTLYIKFE